MVQGFDSGCRRSRRLSRKAITSADCSGVMIRFGILGCGVWKKARSAVAANPGVLAMAWKSGSMAIIRCVACSAVTVWQGEHTSIDAKDIDVSVSGDMLVLKGEKLQEKEEKDKN